MLLIGESINGSIASVGKAILSRNADFICQLAREQQTSGADILDINAGVPEGAEATDLPWLVHAVQGVVDLPLMLDSVNTGALDRALSVCRGRPIINSLSGERLRLESVLPLVGRHHCQIVIICLDDKGIPPNPEGRLEVAIKVTEQAIQSGLEMSDIYLDPVILAIGTDWQAAKVSLETLRLLKERLPQARSVLGISNVSFGMPRRRLLNATFLAMAMGHGLDAAILDVRNRSLMAVVRSAGLLAGKDPLGRAYLRAYRNGLLAG